MKKNFFILILLQLELLAKPSCLTNRVQTKTCQLSQGNTVDPAPENRAMVINQNFYKKFFSGWNFWQKPCV